MGLFNKKKPFENRDPRLRLGFVVPGDRYGDFITVETSNIDKYKLYVKVKLLESYEVEL